ncbi:hypothetical protein KNP414_07522 [Paenibacillus mucilaginosus KNP414]|uniref:Uncharacterized protein n=1 Tax=Paenibacillus mucilaginosus (strain KNP414) TaxID=1036673 RepID=F8FA43_PAEMK|nr:hypothetical protein KNP414_07522 [Paenibacillus mucilaginosus KNP414]
MTRTTCTFLFPRFTATTANFRTTFGFVRTCTKGCALHQDSFIQDMKMRLDAEYRFSQLHFTNLSTTHIKYRYFWHVLSSFLAILSFYRRFNGNVAVLRTRNGTFDQKHVTLNVDLNNFETLNRNCLGTHVTWQVLTFWYTVRLDGTHRTWTAVITGTVSHRTSGLVMSLDNTLEPFTFGSTRYINEFTFSKHVSFDFLANFVLGNRNTAKLFNVALRCCACFLSVAQLRFVCVLFFLIGKTDLDGLVPVVLNILLLQHCARTCLNNCYWYNQSFGSKHLSHPKFLT